MLKNKNEIENYDLKAKVLIDNGWETWYHDDNWIKTEWNKQGIKIDNAGISTDVAYYQYSLEKEEENLKLIEHIIKTKIQLTSIKKENGTEPIEID